jgi:5-hydroxyisourate hydrolase
MDYFFMYTEYAQQDRIISPSRLRTLMNGRLTTHVLDVAQGCPAINMEIELWSLPNSGEKHLLTCMFTNREGRTDVPLLADGALLIGMYELVFAVGNYFAGELINVSQPPFLDRVPIRFGIANPDAHYHIPLLVSPWAYSTYRGS